MWRRSAELRVRVRLSLCNVWPESGTAGASTSFVVGGGVEAIVEEVQVVFGLGGGEATEGVLQVLVVHGLYGNRGVTDRLHLLASTTTSFSSRPAVLLQSL